MSWVSESERTPEALKYLRALGQLEAEALVPALWCNEIANVLLTMERSKKLSLELIAKWMEVFCTMPITVFPATVEHSLIEVWPLARAHGLSVYDASYLHLAMLEQVPLATLDRQLIKAATKVGVTLLE
jgi:predicted nucleic acid-binding protein